MVVVDPLRSLAEQVYQNRTERDELKAQIDTLRASWETSVRGLLDAYTQAASKVSEGEAKLRAEAVAQYELNNRTSKKLPYGLGIREKTVVAIADELSILNWATEKEMFLTVDRKSFDKFVTATGFVVWKGTRIAWTDKVPEATIPTDLGKALAKEVVNG